MGQPGDVGSFGAPFREALKKQLGLTRILAQLNTG